MTLPETARSAVFADPRHIRIESTPVPSPGPDDVLVRLEGCGVCASNLPVWQGRPWFRYPLEPGAPGHEGWGRVVAVGSNVQTLHPDDRVALLSQHAYGEYDTAPAALAVKLPPELDGRPFPGEPLGCAMNIFARGDIHPGQTVAVVGIGFMGALLTQLCAGAGARVIALSRRDYALETARRCGAAETVDSRDFWPAVERVRELTGGRGCERVIEAVGEQPPLDLATELTGERGRLIIAGYHQDGPRQVNLQQWNWRGLDVINAHERDPQAYVMGMRAALAMILADRFHPDHLYTHRLSLDELPRAFELMEERPAGFLKGLLMP